MDCIKQKKSLFGRIYEKEEHDFAYINNVERVCINCYKREIKISSETPSGGIMYQWVKKYNP